MLLPELRGQPQSRSVQTGVYRCCSCCCVRESATGAGRRVVCIYSSDAEQRVSWVVGDGRGDDEWFGEGRASV